MTTRKIDMRHLLSTMNQHQRLL